MFKIKTLMIGIVAFWLTACSTTLASDVKPVTSFDADRYLGKWYEIARIENRFEKNLTHVTADYSKRDDGGIKVVNRGYDTKDGKWEDAVGKAFFVDGPDKGHLKVSFFGPFYGPYVVFDLESNYQYSFVTNNNKKYLWLLSRTPQINPEIKNRFETMIRQMSFDTEKLVWVDQSSKLPNNAEN